MGINFTVIQEDEKRNHRGPFSESAGRSVRYPRLWDYVS